MSMFGTRMGGASATTGTELPVVTPGTYLVHITNVEARNGNDAAKGWRGVRFEFTIADGPQKGRKVWETFTVALNFTPPVNGRGFASQEEVDAFLDEQAGHMVGLLSAAGHPNPQQPESAAIKGRKLGVKIIAKNRRDGNGKENSVVGWMAPDKVPAKKSPAGPGGMSFGGQPGGGMGYSQYQQGYDAQAPANNGGTTGLTGQNGANSFGAGMDSSGGNGQQSGHPMEDEIPF